MNTTTRCLGQDGYLLVKVLTPWTEEAATQMIEDARVEATKLGHKRILFDLTEWSSPASEITRFHSGKYLAEALAPHYFKMAAFALPEAINRLGENAAVNRGAWFRVFPDKAKAVEWLMDDANRPDAGDAAQRA